MGSSRSEKSARALVSFGESCRVGQQQGKCQSSGGSCGDGQQLVRGSVRALVSSSESCGDGQQQVREKAGALVSSGQSCRDGQHSFLEAPLSFLGQGVSKILIVIYFQCRFVQLLRRWSLLKAQCDSIKQIHLYDVCLKTMNRKGHLSPYLFLFCFVS